MSTTQKRFAFTMAGLTKLRPPRDKRLYVYDAKVAGLTMCITANDSRSFYWVKKVDGRAERIRLGGFPELSVDTARDLASKHNAAIAGGMNPAESKRKVKGELTLGELWTLYVEFHAEAHKKPRSVAEDAGLWKRYISPLQSRKLSTIANRDVQQLHSKVGRTNGKYAANRMLSLLSTMLNVAKKHGVGPQVNPCEGVKRFAEKSRDRFLQPDELPRFLAALDKLSSPAMADAFRLMLFTGARKSNVLSAQWQDIDFESNIWHILDTKQNEPQRVPLTTEALAVLNRLKVMANGSPYVFPSPKAGTKYGHVTDVMRAWRELRNVAELPQLRMHDLRRTMGSWQALGGTSLQVIGKSLGHKNSSTTEVYARIMDDPVRQAMEKASAAMAATVKPAQSTNDAPEGIG